VGERTSSGSSVIRPVGTNRDSQHVSRTTKDWYFDTKQGELRLNYKNCVECAEQLFKGIPDLYRYLRPFHQIGNFDLQGIRALLSA